MLSVLWLAFGSLLRMFHNRRDPFFENFVLRQQFSGDEDLSKGLIQVGAPFHHCAETA
jgi:hypothetical protein